MTGNNKNTFLRADKNRKQLRSELSAQLDAGIVEPSILKSATNAWQDGNKPRILLLVPYYTRISRPLD